MYTGTVTIRNTTWSVEIATTATEVAQGLSGRASLSPLHGMLFDLGKPYPEILINMQGMLFPLDAIFMNESFEVVGIAIPLDPGLDFNATFPGTPGARYFLEINQGEAVAAGVAYGDVATIGGYVPPKPVDISGLFTGMLMLMVVGMMMVSMQKMVK